MRNTFSTIIPILASTASLSNAFLSPYFTDWEETIPDCPNGPTPCNLDGPCEEGNVCYLGVLCSPVQRFTNTDLTCDEGTVLDPLAWSKCITIEEQYALFCYEPKVEVEEELEPEPLEEIPEPAVEAE